MKIKAALSAGAHAPFEIAELELDDPRPDEALVRMTAAGVCHTDLTMKAMWPQELSPVVLGHEGAGVVLNVLEPGPGASLVIFGAGGVGLSAVMAAVPPAWRRSSP
jgi:Zn-dependent alcohol dehydrogenase